MWISGRSISPDKHLDPVPISELFDNDDIGPNELEATSNERQQNKPTSDGDDGAVAVKPGKMEVTDSQVG